MKAIKPNKLVDGMIVLAKAPMPARVWRREKGRTYLTLENYESTDDVLDGNDEGTLRMCVVAPNLPYVRLIHQDIIPVLLVVDTREVRLYRE